MITTAQTNVNDALDMYAEPADTYEMGKRDAYENASEWLSNADGLQAFAMVDEAMAFYDNDETLDSYEQGKFDAYENVWQWLNLASEQEA